MAFTFLYLASTSRRVGRGIPNCVRRAYRRQLLQPLVQFALLDALVRHEQELELLLLVPEPHYQVLRQLLIVHFVGALSFDDV